MDSAQRPRVSPFVVFSYDIVVPLCRLGTHCVALFGLTLLVGLAVAAFEGPAARAQVAAAVAEFDALNFTADQAASLRAQYGLAVPYDESSRAWTPLNSQYFATVMLTTTGYGDLAPQSTGGRIMAVASMVVCGPLLGYLLHLAGKNFIQALFGAQLLLCSLCRRVDHTEGRYHVKARKLVAALAGSDRRLTLRELYTLLCHWQEPDDSLIQYLGSESPVESMALPAAAPTGSSHAGVSWLDACAIMEEADLLQRGYLEQQEARKALLAWARRTMRDEQIHSPTVLVYIAALVVCWLFTGAVLFSYLENITVGDGFWLSFVTLSTIGYGDFAPTSTVNRLCWFAYVCIGFGLMARLLVAVSYYVGEGSQRALSGHLQFSLYYDWSFRKRGRVASRLKLFWPLVWTLGYAMFGGFLMLKLESDVPAPEQGQSPVWDNPGYSPEQQTYLRASLDIPGPEWTYPNVLRLAAASMTTIGYGDMVPRTNGARLAIMIYATLGIGIVGVSLSQIAASFYRGVANSYRLLQRLLPFLLPDLLWDEDAFEREAHTMLAQIDAQGHLTLEDAWDIVHDVVASAGDRVPLRALIDQLDRGDGTVEAGELETVLAQWLLKRMRMMALTKFISSAVLFAGMMTGFAGAFTCTDGWPYGDSLWFTWVTVTTTGFGDLVPAQPVGVYLNVALILINLGFFANFLTSASAVLTSAALLACAALTRRTDRWRRERAERKRPRPPRSHPQTACCVAGAEDGDTANSKGPPIANGDHYGEKEEEGPEIFEEDGEEAGDVDDMDVPLHIDTKSHGRDRTPSPPASAAIEVQVFADDERSPDPGDGPPPAPTPLDNPLLAMSRVLKDRRVMVDPTAGDGAPSTADLEARIAEMEASLGALRRELATRAASPSPGPASPMFPANGQSFRSPLTGSRGTAAFPP